MCMCYLYFYLLKEHELILNGSCLIFLMLQRFVFQLSLTVTLIGSHSWVRSAGLFVRMSCSLCSSCWFLVLSSFLDKETHRSDKDVIKLTQRNWLIFNLFCCPFHLCMIVWWKWICNLQVWLLVLVFLPAWSHIYMRFGIVLSLALLSSWVLPKNVWMVSVKFNL